MADVRLTIAGRAYDVHCADGQEQQLIQLAAIVDEKARGITGGTEVRQLLFSALMLADEALEAKARVNKAEPQSDSLRAAVALAESREAEVRGELANARAEIAALRKAAESQPVSPAAPPAGPQTVPSARPSHDRALLAIADRIETLAAEVERLA
ncbi:MAG: cell division protein ZapA [Sphingopyxis sp.]|uniref:cell division protein ZapA n=1 Tax=Sphingopyxis sp. TaxID=1908224 RepID=UPI002ABC4377|nr:cell division protein ZapA [Sphingopyxis sp.]MDZ3830966.1 cell division protein ZapA [Sphingopyxis sp.]